LEALVNSLLKMSRKISEEMRPNPPSSIHPPGVHKPIVDAVLAGDPEGAAEAMRVHARVFYDNLVRMEKYYREHESEAGRPKGAAAF
jgi:DNA-binding GntR family transcriptional regulator